MNHREIEYTIRQYWKEHNIAEKNAADLFRQWSNQEEKEAAVQLMVWLEQTQKEVFLEDLLLDYGADCLRLYLLFEKTPKPDDIWLDTWEECNLEGCYKFLSRFRRMILVADYANGLGMFQNLDVSQMQKRVYMLQKEVMRQLAKGNTMPNRHNAVALMMECVHEMQKEMRIGELVTGMHSHEIEEAVPHADKQETKVAKQQEKSRNTALDEVLKNMLLLLAPFAPLLAEQLWQHLQSGETSICDCVWKEQYAQPDMIKLPIQVNAKTKKVLVIAADAGREEIEEKARQEISQLLQGKDYQVVYVPGKIMNFVLTKVQV